MKTQNLPARDVLTTSPDVDTIREMADADKALQALQAILGELPKWDESAGEFRLGLWFASADDAMGEPGDELMADIRAAVEPFGFVAGWLGEGATGGDGSHVEDAYCRRD